MVVFFFFFKQKTAYEIVSRDWSSDVCSSDLRQLPLKNKNPEINAHVFRLLADKHFIYFQFDINDKTSLCNRIVLT